MCESCVFCIQIEKQTEENYKKKPTAVFRSATERLLSSLLTKVSLFSSPPSGSLASVSPGVVFVSRLVLILTTCCCCEAAETYLSEESKMGQNSLTCQVVNFHKWAIAAVASDPLCHGSCFPAVNFLWLLLFFASSSS